MKLKKLIVLLAMVLLFNNVSYAGANNSLKYVDGTSMYSSGEDYTIGYREKKMRGEFAAVGILRLENLKDGYAGIFAQTLTHVPVDKIKMRVYLDILDTTDEQWKNVSYYDFSYLKEDYADGDLSDPYEDFKVLVKKNNMYRLRGMYMVWLDGTTEGFNVETEGLYITY